MTTAYSKRLNPKSEPTRYANGGEVIDESQWRGGYVKEPGLQHIEKMRVPDSVSVPKVVESGKLDDAPKRYDPEMRRQGTASRGSAVEPAPRRSSPRKSSPKPRPKASSASRPASVSKSSAAEPTARGRRGRVSKNKILDTAGVDPKTLLPKR